MKRSLALTLTTIFLLFLVTECDRPESPTPVLTEYGYLSLSVALQIEALPASGRAEAVSPDNFIVTIYNADDGTIAEQWNTYLEVPEEVQLPTGTYYVTATNLAEPEDAAFEQPWYYGESEVFTIDKEEQKIISLTCTLANCKISFSYSQNVLANFTNWNATATIDDGNRTGAFLEWIQSDASEGYFLTDLPIDIEVYLEYIKLTDTDQSITRTFSTTIDDPQPATHYLINVDAALEDGEIVININVDEGFETVEISLGDESGGEDPQEATVTDVDGNEYPTVQIGDQVWMAENLEVTQLNDGTSLPKLYGNDWILSSTPAYGTYNNTPEPTYGNFYNWYAVESGKLCPTGWHIPSFTELQIFAENLGGYGVAGGKIKVTDGNWTEPNSGATNESGFSAYSAGFRFAHSGTDAGLGTHAYWWSSTLRTDGNVHYMAVYSSGVGISTANFGTGNGISVRCLKD